jgi:glycosyltransferase involved in cell wall biosynthesis
VIHGYPPRYAAGSEIYTQVISQGLVRAGHQVAVLCREEDPLRPDYDVRSESDGAVPEISVRVVNMPRTRERFRHAELDRIYAGLVREFSPDVVHFGHLNHLSTGMLGETHRAGIPSVFTLHDFWLMCPRGQFLQYGVSRDEPWALCDGQDDLKCATKCYAPRYRTGLDVTAETEVEYWRTWVGERMDQVRKALDCVSVFIAPSRTLQDRFLREFHVPPERIAYLDYGFDLTKFGGRRRVPRKGFVIGYISTHRPAKGLQILIDAIPLLSGNFKVHIWGRPSADVTPALRDRVSRFSPSVARRIEWMGEYDHMNMVRDVLDHVDVVVVPSIWLENSPLVIHEAQQARLPVVATDLGGMAELVHDGKNGLLFKPRDHTELASALQRLINNPGVARELGARGYLYSDDGAIPSLDVHIRALEQLYERAIQSRGSGS